VRGGFPFQRFSFVRHLAPTAGQIQIRYSKHIIGCLSGAMATLVGPLPTFVSTVQHHCCHHATSVTVQTDIPPTLVLKGHTLDYPAIEPPSDVGIAANIAKLPELLQRSWSSDWSLTNGPNPMRGDSYALLRLSAARFTRANRDTCLLRRILGGRVIFNESIPRYYRAPARKCDSSSSRRR
jgi:hypothetical protein